MVKDCLARALAVEVPIEVVCEVYYRTLVAFREVCNLEVILVVEVVYSLYDKLTRIALLAILRYT